MRAFIVLCLVAVACADKLGYDYHPVGHSSSGLSFTPGSGASYSGASYGGNSGVSFGSGSGSSFGSGSGSFGSGSSIGSSFGSSGSSFGSGASYGAASNNVGSYSAPAATLEKEFYTFSANDADFNEPAASNNINAIAKKNLRVIFIKGPENNHLENAVLGLAKQAAEQKTAIYVLNKQTDLSGLAEKINTVSTNVNHKPEVHFVKYRTPEDAANAQRAIQSQYDSLGGTSQSFNGGVAPALNFASQSTHSSFNSGATSSYGVGPQIAYNSGSFAPGASTATSATYLPASVLRRLRH
ncbi:secreted protein C-like [Musca vetustissima]|uniref:secreted protein C-like n=1 Tax=Musca vetustissima TaxID=27455 RepID=UPI002AB685F2|nr:secreted protein C-like [Musca vetustissima]